MQDTVHNHFRQGSCRYFQLTRAIEIRLHLLASKVTHQKSHNELVQMNSISICIRPTLISEFSSSDAITYVADTSSREYWQPPLRIFSGKHLSTLCKVLDFKGYDFFHRIRKNCIQFIAHWHVENFIYFYFLVFQMFHMFHTIFNEKFSTI